MAVTEFADNIGRFSIVLMWAALIIRWRPAMKGRQQRGLWLAVLTAAIATTLFQPQIIDRAVDITGDAHAVTLSRNLVGVVAAGLTLLLFVGDSARPRRAGLITVVTLIGTALALLGMDLVSGDPAGPSIPADGGPATPSAAYWVLVCGAHLVADAAIVVICWRYSRRTDDRDLVWSLRLFAFGSVLAAGYWAACLVHVYVRIPDALPYLAVIINVHGVSRALTLLVPTAFSLARRARDARTVWVLWPMWRDLSAAVPTISLAPPRATRLRQFLRPRSPLALQAHRQLIEIYDAVLHLQSHLSADVYRQACDHAEDLRIADHRVSAAALAGALVRAQRAKLFGAPGHTATESHALSHLGQANKTLLLAMARHWPSVSRALPVPKVVDTSP
ncbi:MAB_1171c family putative transporter [Streptomyces sp. B6B3]|uniref:MAB_1171c family putative transporter n=1 Tax=Streptomyces sp. B6B3 TaxID=3153570 RepID=UPI00325CD655